VSSLGELAARLELDSGGFRSFSLSQDVSGDEGRAGMVRSEVFRFKRFLDASFGPA
jgi:hypothetical protein